VVTILNLLVVCGQNKKRSRTAESIYKNDSRLSIRSAGLSPQSRRKLSRDDLSWASLVLVMESKHKKKIRELFGRNFSTMDSLEIPDEYEYLDPALIELLKSKIEPYLTKENDHGNQEEDTSKEDR
jgi:predicted protein tyrosine phosphatase